MNDEHREDEGTRYESGDDGLEPEDAPAAEAPGRARSFGEVLEKEREAIRKGRALRSARPGATDEDDDPQVTALAFSGGGIRSAIFNLGIAQGLARLGLLKRFDYLSVNSGGGYIGGWLLAWIRRAGIDQVERELRRDACRDDGDGEPADPGDAGSAGAEAEPISFLRRFSNYLTPRAGAFSADTWTMVTTYLRNLLLNQVILVLALAAILVVPRILVLASSWFSGLETWVLLLCSVAGLTVAVILIACNHTEVLLPRDGGPPWYARQNGIQLGVLLPLFVAAWFAGLWMWFSRAAEQLFLHEWLAQRWSWYASSRLHQDQLEPLAWALLAAVLYVGVWLLGLILLTVLVRRRAHGAADVLKSKRRMFRAVVLTAPLAGGLGGFLLWVVASLSLALEASLTPMGYQGPWHLLHVNVWKAPAITVVFMLTAFVHTGLMGRAFAEELRQWWSRLGAWMLIWSITWLGVFGIALYGPILLVIFGTLICGALGGGWLASTVGGVLVGRDTTNGDARPPLWRRAVIAVAPQIFIVGMLAAIALGVHALLDPPEEYLSPDCQQFWVQAPAPDEGDLVQDAEAELSAEDRRVRRILRCHTERLYLGTTRAFSSVPDAPVATDDGNQATTPLAFLLLAVSALVLSWRVDINEFSMHLFYRNRLIRAFLGASNRKRRAQPFTGFDPGDDLAVASLSPDVEREGRVYDGPYPILNIALNLVSGEELAWQERKAASFVFTPLFSGYQVHDGGEPDPVLRPVGFRPTDGYLQIPDEGISLGTAMTISGAAASPSMGAGTTPAMAFLLTVFNVRLGWWLGNPRHERTWSRMGPRIGLLSLLAELFGSTNDRSHYVYLSDGGHFDNLALYELIRRRCRFIVVSDAGADPDMTFEDLGNAVRKCCTDFGVEIDIDPDQIHKDPETGLSHWHCAVGRIRYDHLDGGPPGTLVYVKASLTGDEPIDDQAYSAANEEFPHQSTADQWFSESQFESYRKLGEHVALSVFGAVDDAPGALSREELFVRLGQTWFPPSSVSGGVFTRLTSALDELMERLRTDDHLAFLVPQIFPEWPELAGAVKHVPPPRMWLPETHDELVAGFFFCHALIQLMEDCYLDLDLDHELEHPDNRGWMNLFKHWSWAGMLRVTWAVTASTFGARFQVFCRRRLGLEVGEVRVERESLPTGGSRLSKLLELPAVTGRLNFLEQRLMRDMVERHRDTDTLLVLRLGVRDPSGTSVGGEEDEAAEIQFTFGFALARGRELLYLRVQDHLRKMGLARAALRRLVREDLVRGVIELSADDLPEWSRKTAGESRVGKLTQLFRSARQQEEA
jgi:predicted acylesterase/phospholipase RssA